MTQDLRKISPVGKLFIVGTDEDIARLKPGFLRHAALFHRAHQHAFAVLYSEVFSKLAAQVFSLHSQHRRIALHLDRESWNLHLRTTHARDDHLGFDRSSDFSAIGKLEIDVEGIAVAADAKRYVASRRYF